MSIHLLNTFFLHFSYIYVYGNIYGKLPIFTNLNNLANIFQISPQTFPIVVY